MTARVACFIVATVTSACVPPGSHFTPETATPPATVQMLPNRDWTDTGLQVRRGQWLFLTATGEVSWQSRQQKTGPDGWRGYPGWWIGPGGVIGRVDGKTFDVGARTQPFLSKYLRVHHYYPPPPIKMPTDGTLYLGFKDFASGANAGQFDVTIRGAR